MKRTMQCISVAIFTFVFAVALNAAPSPVGVWKTIDDKTMEAKSYVEIWEKGGIYYGKVNKIITKPGEDPNPLCTECNGINKDKPVIGMMIIWGMKNADEELTGGNIMDPDNGKIYKCKMKVLDNGKKLEVRGFIGFSLLGRSQYWHRDK